MRGHIDDPIFIGGSPTAGKSFVSRELAKRLHLPILEIDEFRDDVRRLAKEKPALYPTFAYEIGVTAEQYWQHRTPEEVMQNEIKEGHEIWPLVQAKIEAGFNGIVEGVSILPELLHVRYGSNVRVVFLADQDPERIREAVYGRGVWDDANTYADWVKELEVQWLPMHARWFIRESEKYGYPCIEVRRREDVLDEVLRILKL